MLRLKTDHRLYRWLISLGLYAFSDIPIRVFGDWSIRDVTKDVVNSAIQGIATFGKSVELVLGEVNNGQNKN